MGKRRGLGGFGPQPHGDMGFDGVTIPYRTEQTRGAAYVSQQILPRRSSGGSSANAASCHRFPLWDAVKRSSDSQTPDFGLQSPVSSKLASRDTTAQSTPSGWPSTLAVVEVGSVPCGTTRQYRDQAG